jgi:hypothetical protein
MCDGFTRQLKTQVYECSLKEVHSVFENSWESFFCQINFSSGLGMKLARLLLLPLLVLLQQHDGNGRPPWAHGLERHRQVLLKCTNSSRHAFLYPEYLSVCVCDNPSFPFCEDAKGEWARCKRLQGSHALQPLQHPLYEREQFNEAEVTFFEGFSPTDCEDCHCVADVRTPRPIERTFERHALLQSHIRAGLRPMRAILYECRNGQLCGGECRPGVSTRGPCLPHSPLHPSLAARDLSSPPPPPRGLAGLWPWLH